MKLTNIFTKLVEALKPSEYRPYVKNWDKKRYEELFKNHQSADKHHFRIYLPLHGEKKPVHPLPEVVSAVKDAGYEIMDYLTGIASKVGDPKRQIKIGKLLKDPEVQNKFANDPQRRSSKNAEFYVVISRHPYDIAGMSTDRGWKSCMNLKDGVNRHYVALDVKEGTLIAYVVKSDDKNINRPVGRVLIKPFVNISNSEEIALGVENRVYGTDVPGFRQQVVKWADEINNTKDLNGVFTLSNKLYNDGGANQPKMIGKNFTDAQRIYHNPDLIKDIENPSEELQMMAVLSRPASVQFIKNPTKKVIKTIISKVGAHYFGYMKRIGVKIPDETATELFQDFPEMIGYISHPTLEQFKDAFERGGTQIMYYLMEAKPPLEFLMWALSKDVGVIRYFEDHHHTEQLHDYLLQHHFDPKKEETWNHALYGIRFASKKTIEKLVQLAGGHKVLQHLDYYDGRNKISKKQGDAAVKEDPEALKRIPKKYISPPVQLEAALKDPKVINYIKKDLREKVIEENPDAIRYVVTGNEMTGKMSQIGLHLSWIAVKKKPEVIKHIDMPPEDMVQYCVDHDPKLLLNVKTKYWPIKAMAAYIVKNPSDGAVAYIQDALKRSRLYSKKWQAVLNAVEVEKRKSAGKKIDALNGIKKGTIISIRKSGRWDHVQVIEFLDDKWPDDEAEVVVKSTGGAQFKYSYATLAHYMRDGDLAVTV